MIAGGGHEAEMNCGGVVDAVDVVDAGIVNQSTNE